jgi:hypothetical protein
MKTSRPSSVKMRRKMAMNRRLLPSAVVLALLLARTELESFTNDAMGIRGVVPQGWAAGSNPARMKTATRSSSWAAPRTSTDSRRRSRLCRHLS